MLSVTYAECSYVELRYAECSYAECRYAECRGSVKTVVMLVTLKVSETRQLCSAQNLGKIRLKLQSKLGHFLKLSKVVPQPALAYVRQRVVTIPCGVML